MRLSELGIPILLPLWLALAALMARAVLYFAGHHQLGVDAHAFWLADRHSHPYERPPMMRDAYLYSPAFRQAIMPIAWLPWAWFLTIWAAAEAAAFAWLLRPLGWAWGVPAFLFCGFEIIAGNIMGFLAVALVLGARHPQAWVLPLFTKVSITLGPLYWALRREWRPLLHFALAAGILLAASIAFAPHQWSEWISFLLDHRSADPTLLYRLVGAVAIVAVAARRKTPWLLAPAMVLASPILHGVVQYLTLLAAIPRLRRLPAETELGAPRSRAAAPARRQRAQAS